MTAHVDPNAAHAVYAPSSAHRWTVCTASAEAISRLPEQESSEAAEEGTDAHEELERVLSGGTPNKDHPGAYGVALAVDYIRQLPAGRTWIEERVTLTSDIWGRLDFGHWHEESLTVTVLDLKNGFVDVSPVQNPQTRTYGASLILQHKLPAKWIRYAIVQPNSIVPGPRVKDWVESVDDLMEFATRAAAVPGGPKEFKVGEQCKYCPLFGRCPASQDVLAQLGAALCNAPEDVPPAQRALLKTCEKPISDWFKNADKAWLKDAMTTAPAPGMKIVTTTTRRDWIDAAAARVEVVSTLGVDALDLPTPAQAEKLGMDKAKVAKLAAAPPGGPALALESDRRPEWVRKSAAEMFGSVLEGGK